VTHFWSLAVEEQFYIVWPVVVLSMARFVDPRHLHRALAATLIAGIAVSAWWSIHLSAADPVAAYYSPFTRFWELGLGCLLATVASSRPIRFVWLERLAAGLGVALLVVAFATFNSASVYPGWRAWLPCAGTAALIWAGVGAGAPSRCGCCRFVPSAMWVTSRFRSTFFTFRCSSWQKKLPLG